MSIEVGSIVDGVVSGITNFGAFINLPENKVGLVHISEVADVYVKDVNDFLKEQDKVKVKILSVDDKGKIALSVKQAQEKKPEERPQQREQRSFNARPQRESGAPMRHEGFRASGGDFRRSSSRFGSGSNASFEDKLSRFLKDSDERLTDLSRKTDSKRGGRGGGRRR